jgi:hypothetical protein
VNDNPYNPPTSPGGTTHYAMPAQLPLAGRIGLLASATAVALWAAEQLTGQRVFQHLTIPFKLTLLVTPLFFYHDLSGFLQGRLRLAVALALTLVAVTILAALAYLPWREAFARKFNNDAYRWYSNDPRWRGSGDPRAFDAWQSGWGRRVPHRIEAAIAVAYYFSIVGICSRRRLGRVGGLALGLGGYAMLLVIPMLTGLIVWDYDTFLRGIIFDSISMDLSPICLWYAGDFSIFLYAFMLIFFGVCAGFMFARPRRILSVGSVHSR